MGRNNYSFRWIEKVDDPETRENIENLLRACKIVASYNYQKIELEPTDYEGTRQDLRFTMKEIYQSTHTEETNGHNPLWDAMMYIRPKMLLKQVPKHFIRIISTELREIIRETQEAQGDQKMVDFFTVLAKEMGEFRINICRALRSGDVVVERRKDGNNVLHGFPFRIPQDIAQEVGLKLTTKLDNLQAHKAAVAEMRKRNLVSEKVGEALQIMAEDLYALLEGKRN